MQSAYLLHENPTELPADPLKAFITTRLARNETPTQIADAVKVHLGIAIDRAQVIPYWKGEITLPTQTERRPDKESVQIPADEIKEPLFTRMADGEAATAPFSITPDPDQGADDARAEFAPPTQTGRRQNQESASTLTDEVKTFIVKALARYDTPSQVAEAVKADFGIEISRQRVFAYDPEGSRPPAPRWCALHAATRQAFLAEVAQIGVAHKAVRLRILDRLAHRCERNNVALALDCLEQAAKECGGIYESRKSSPPPPKA
jgi:hypothetical protein